MGIVLEAIHQVFLGEAGAAAGLQLSGYRCDLYDAFADEHGWRRVDFDIANHASHLKAKRRMVESVWMNFADTSNNSDT